MGFWQPKNVLYNKQTNLNKKNTYFDPQMIVEKGAVTIPGSKSSLEAKSELLCQVVHQQKRLPDFCRQAPDSIVSSLALES